MSEPVGEELVARLAEIEELKTANADGAYRQMELIKENDDLRTRLSLAEARASRLLELERAAIARRKHRIQFGNYNSAYNKLEHAEDAAIDAFLALLPEQTETK